MRTALLLTCLFMAVSLTMATSQCQWGPSYWCQSKDTAKQCGQLNYCQEHIWKTTTQQRVADVGSGECDFCKLVVEIADKFVDSNDTEEAVEKLVKDECAYFGGFAGMCVSFVDQYFDQIWAMLESETDPSTVCADLKFCTSSKKTSKQLPSKPMSIECDVCELVARFLMTFVKDNSTEADAKAALDEFCGKLPGDFGSECKSLVDEYFDDIWKLLLQLVSPDEVCKMLGLCDTDFHKFQQDEGCDFCKELADFLAVYVDNNVTEEDVKELVQYICTFISEFAPQYESTCKSILDNFDMYWDLLEMELDGDEICYQIGVCTTLHKIRTRPTAAAPKDTNCDTCKLIVAVLEPLLDSNATETEAKQLLEQLCVLIKNPECDALVKDYFSLVWQLLLDELKGDEICLQLGICKQAGVAVAMAEVSVLKDVECEACEVIVKLLKPLIDRNATEGELKKALGRICPLLPSEYKSECETFLKDDFDLFWTILKQEVDDGELCALVKACNSTTPALRKPSVVVAKQSVKDPKLILCSLCELVMEKLAGMLVDNATEAEIAALLEKVCDVLPEEFRPDCEEFINDYGKEIIQALVDGVAPKLVCTLLGLCFVEQPNTKVFSFDTGPEIDDCGVCELVLDFVKDIVGENFTKSAVVAALDDVCDKFPSALKAECTDFVNEYGDEVVQLIDKAIDPKAICMDIKLCSATPTSAMASPWKMMEKIFKRV